MPTVFSHAVAATAIAAAMITPPGSPSGGSPRCARCCPTSTSSRSPSRSRTATCSVIGASPTPSRSPPDWRWWRRRSRLADDLLPEDLLEQIGHAGGGIAPDLALLVADHMVEAVEGLADDVAIELVVLGLEKRDGLRLAEEL